MPAFAESAADVDPPLIDSYHSLLRRACDENDGIAPSTQPSLAMSERELPMIDLECLTSGSGSAEERKACVDAMARAASDWGFFQVVSHGIRQELLEKMQREQARLFRLPFGTKEKTGLLTGLYRWGTPTATSPRQLSWSEAFHVPLASISRRDCDYGELSSLRVVMEEVAKVMSKLANTLALALAENLGYSGDVNFPAGCDETTCFLRMNRYPPCPFAANTFGLVPHTDSDFLTVLCQDQVGGLQLMKGSHWVAVKPHPDALIVNIGDLFQAWSNDRYKSVEHKVMANAKAERYSVAYFLCPSNESPIGTCREPSMYRSFTFGEYRSKVQEDVKITGKKIGLPNFLKIPPTEGPK